jgi:hypothetical protein
MRLILAGAMALALLSCGASAQQASDASSKGYTGAYDAAGPATPYWTGTLPQSDTGSGLDVPGPNDTTRTVRAVPCGTAAHETDGSTTCVGLPERKR